MTRPLLLFLFLLAVWPRPLGGKPQNTDWAQARKVVKPRAYVSLEPVPRGRTFELAVVAEIERGFHINAHEVSDSYLIPTTLEAQVPAGFRVLGTTYPSGQPRKFAFAEQPLSVYEGSATLRMRVEAGQNASLGDQKVSLMLYYQACSLTTCLPPVKLPVVVEVKVAPAGTRAQAVHPEVFASPKPAAKTPAKS